MNIKLKAGLEVAGIITAVVAITAGTQALLSKAVDTFGVQAVFNGITFGVVSALAYFAVSFLYNIRVAQLKLKEELKRHSRTG